MSWRETLAMLGPLERAKLNHWEWDSYYVGSLRKSYPQTLVPEMLFYSCLESWIKDKVHNCSDPESRGTFSEPGMTGEEAAKAQAYWKMRWDEMIRQLSAHNKPCITENHKESVAMVGVLFVVRADRWSIWRGQTWFLPFDSAHWLIPLAHIRPFLTFLTWNRMECRSLRWNSWNVSNVLEFVVWLQRTKLNLA
jgi:hypothetical protein